MVRDFTVEEGTVRYFGTPDLNAELNITAKYIAEDIDTRQEIEIIARITGTLIQPKLALESDQHPPSPRRNWSVTSCSGVPASR